MSFQTKINQQLPYAVAGQRASTNPAASAVAVNGQYVVGTGGAIVGQFAGLDGSGNITNANFTGAPIGFIERDLTGAITAWLGESTMTLQAGQIVTPMVAGEFWVTTPTGGATAGQKVYAANADGSILLDAAGVTHAGYTETKFYAAMTTVAGDMLVISTYGN
jgi:hypothetical protein